VPESIQNVVRIFTYVFQGLTVAVLHILMAFAPLTAGFLKCQICTNNYTLAVIRGENNMVFATSDFEPPKTRRKAQNGNNP